MKKGWLRLASLFLLAFFCVFCWTLYSIHIDRLNAALLVAVKQQNKLQVVSLVKQGADANVRDIPHQPRTLTAHLHKLLHPNSYDVTSAPSALHLALTWQSNHMEFNQIKGNSISFDGLSNTLKDDSIVRALLNYGANPNARVNGMTPLMLATLLGNVKVTTLLLQKNVNIDAMDDPTVNSSAKVLCRMLSILPERESATVKGTICCLPNLFPFDQGTQWSSLMFAIASGHADIAQLLLARGADVQHKGSDGQTPLSLARTSGDHKLIQLVERYGGK